jgi:hypothetical protein
VNWRSKLIDGLIVVVVVAVVARVVWERLGPLLPSLLVFLGIAGLMLWLLHGGAHRQQ